MNFESCGYRCHSFSWTFNLLESKPQSSCPIFTLLLRLMVNIRFSMYAKFWLHRNLHHSVTYTDYWWVPVLFSRTMFEVVAKRNLFHCCTCQAVQFTEIQVVLLFYKYTRDLNWIRESSLCYLCWIIDPMEICSCELLPFSNTQVFNSRLSPIYCDRELVSSLSRDIVSLLLYIVFGLQLVPGKVNADIQPSCIH